VTLPALPEATQSILTVSPGQIELGATVKDLIWAQPTIKGVKSTVANTANRSAICPTPDFTMNDVQRFPLVSEIQ
ncbi:MAG: hypothetical protein ABJA60_07650, partial [Nitrosospira sp.]